jgi:hypothetical protein
VVPRAVAASPDASHARRVIAILSFPQMRHCIWLFLCPAWVNQQTKPRAVPTLRCRRPQGQAAAVYTPGGSLPETPVLVINTG